jgi:large subunit ribosomal protein L2
MSLRVLHYKAFTNSIRHLVNLEKATLLKDSRIFRVSSGYNSCLGRSTLTGHITAWHRGSGHKRLYHDINFTNTNRFSLVVGVTYDPYRSSLVSINFDFKSRKFFNMISTLNFSPGTLVKELREIKYLDKYVLDMYSKGNHLLLGFRSFLYRIPIGSIINSITVGNKITYTKAAGTKAQLIRADLKSATVKLSTGKLVKVPGDSTASVGVISNEKHRLLVYGKAGRKRNLGRRPIVRGIAMNPVDHPHGGRTNGGRPSVSPWGILTKSKFKLRKKKL